MSSIKNRLKIVHYIKYSFITLITLKEEANIMPNKVMHLDR